MTLGLSLPAFTALHVVISLIAIGTGAVATFGMARGRYLSAATVIFLTTTLLTSVTGFLFPSAKVTPAHAFGVVSLLALALAVPALYRFELAGAWRGVYVVCALLVLYLNAFVLIVQAFQKIPFLNVYAPTGSELPFAIAQLLLLADTLTGGVLAWRRFRPAL
jgi:hypothetical protein